MEDFREALFVVPARIESVGLPRKVLCDVNGQPLIAYTLEFLKRVAPPSRIVVVTDDEEIAQLSSAHGVQVVREPHVRPENENSVRAVQLAITELRREGVAYDYTVIAQPTQPVRTRKLLHDSFVTLRQAQARDETIDGCLTVMPVDAPSLQFRPDETGRITSWLLRPGTRQAMAPVYRVSGNYYIVRTDRYLAKATDSRSSYEKLNWVTEVHPSFPWVDIDYENDRLLFEMMLNAGLWSVDLAARED